MIIWILAALIAFFIKGLCGFANTLVFNSILAFGNSNINISPVELILGYPTNVIMAWKERKSIRKNVCISLSILVLAGSIPGIFILKNTNVTVVKFIFGIVVVFIGCEMLLREIFCNRLKKGKSSKIVLTVIGFISGLLCGLYGIGALLGAYLGRISKDTKEFKANICIVFLVENTFRILLYTLTGIIGFSVLKKALVLIPFMLAGLFLGMKCSSVLNEKIIKKIVIVMLIISGIVICIGSL